MNSFSSPTSCNASTNRVLDETFADAVDLPREAPQDPARLCSGRVLDQPEQSRIGADEAASGGRFVDAGYFPHQRLGAILQQGLQRFTFACGIVGSPGALS